MDTVTAGSIVLSCNLIPLLVLCCYFFPSILSQFRNIDTLSKSFRFIASCTYKANKYTRSIKYLFRVENKTIK